MHVQTVHLVFAGEVREPPRDVVVVRRRRDARRAESGERRTGRRRDRAPGACLRADGRAHRRQLLDGLGAGPHRIGEGLDLRGQVLGGHASGDDVIADALQDVTAEGDGDERILVEQEELLLDPEARHPGQWFRSSEMSSALRLPL